MMPDEQLNIVVHTRQKVNAALAEGRFLMDVGGDGIILYQADNRPLATPRPRTPDQVLATAREHFEKWFPSAVGFLDIAPYVIDQGRVKEAACDLHQAVERLCHCVLPVATFYAPDVHHIGSFRTQADELGSGLIEVWPRAARTDRARFAKLKAAYVKARYSASYSIAPDELDWLTQRVAALAAAVQVMCGERTAELSAAAQAGNDPPED